MQIFLLMGDVHVDPYPRIFRPVGGIPLVLHVLESLVLQEGDAVWLVVHRNVIEHFSLRALLEEQWPSHKVNLVPLDYSPVSIIETALVGLQQLGGHNRADRVLFVDTNYVARSDILSLCRSLPAKGDGVVVANVGEYSPAFSYVIEHESEEGAAMVTTMCDEKVASSTIFAGGLFVSDVQTCFDSFESVLKRFAPHSFGLVISDLLNRGRSLHALHVKTLFHPSSPSHCKDFISELEVSPPSSRQFALHVDSCHVFENPADAIKVLVNLNQSGHDTLLVPSVPKSACSKLPELASSEVQGVYVLPRNSIPQADVVVASHTISGNGLFYSDTLMDGLLAEEGDNKQSDFVDPRHFNEIIVNNNTVTKISAEKVLRGEVYFYQNIPADIKPNFPEYLGTAELSEKRRSLMVSLVDGITFSKLVVGGCLTVARFQTLLDSLHRIHASTGNPAEDKLENIYLNYVLKLKARIASHPLIYKGDLLTAANEVCVRLEEYQKRDRGVHVNVIHGDPVFSNVLHMKTGKVTFLDMRGEVGSKLSLQGDVLYDLGKVYQSVLGYDFFLQGKVPSSREADTLLLLERNFWQHLRRKYPQVRPIDVVLVTASLYLSLIPLHDSHHVKVSSARVGSELLKYLQRENEDLNTGDTLVQRLLS
uniref:Uncharacterized protein n=1 Tax=Palpitomonas bilix TaxID=652834 RepID=A0A7S3G3N5_9EUKA|mmetsp:Transcript_26341/g.67166  ORF Transcript_26341/g.67166 Transcript_26341/m.67166 type:complete len:650 (+) Transcript_26341:629-2578(+)